MMEPSILEQSSSSVTTSVKKKCRSRSKKKSQTSDGNIASSLVEPNKDSLLPISHAISALSLDNVYVANPFLGAIQKPLLLSLTLSLPKQIFVNSSLLGLDSDPNMISIHNIVEYKTLDRYSKKYREIEVLFPPSLKIVKIQQVFNPFLRLSFQLKRNFTYFNVEPLKLFHGTKLKYVHSICTNNFNWRFNGAEKGHRYGQGVNFTPRPKFALNFCEKNTVDKVVILADVLVIKKCIGQSNQEVPPEGFDTTIRENNITFVKFFDGEFYPSYVIFFRHV